MNSEKILSTLFMCSDMVEVNSKDITFTMDMEAMGMVMGTIMDTTGIMMLTRMIALDSMMVPIMRIVTIMDMDTHMEIEFRLRSSQELMSLTS